MDIGYDSREMSFQAVKRRRRQPRPMLHVEFGWPHKSSHYPGFCICLEICCQSEVDGCICPQCPCRHGFSHAKEYEKEKQNAEV